MSRSKVVVRREKYNRGGLPIREPRDGPPVVSGFAVHAASLIEAGRYDDGSEYQVIRYEIDRVTEEAKP